MQHLQTHSLNGIFLCGFFWSSTHKSFQPPDVVFCCLCASRGIITGYIPSLEASPKEVLLKYIHNPRTQGSFTRNRKFDIQRVNFLLHHSLRQPLGDLFNKRKWRNGSCRFVGSVEGLFTFHWYGDWGGLSMSQCLSPEKRVTFLRCLYSMLKRFPCLYVYIYIYCKWS